MLLPAMSPEEYQERKQKILAVDFLSDPPKAPQEPSTKPLHAYQTGNRSLYDMVVDRWTDENNYLMNQYNEKIYTITHQQNLSKQMCSRQIGIAAHDYVAAREEVQSDGARQSVMASLYERRQTKNMPALKKVRSKLSRFLMIGALASCMTLGYDFAHGNGKISPATQITLGITGMMALAALVITAEQQHIHTQGIKIKSNLMCWHHMTPCQRDAVYRDIMAPQNMGLCGFLETFQPTR